MRWYTCILHENMHIYKHNIYFRVLLLNRWDEPFAGKRISFVSLLFFYRCEQRNGMACIATCYFNTNKWNVCQIFRVFCFSSISITMLIEIGILKSLLGWIHICQTKFPPPFVHLQIVEISYEKQKLKSSSLVFLIYLTKNYIRNLEMSEFPCTRNSNSITIRDDLGRELIYYDLSGEQWKKNANFSE